MTQSLYRFLKPKNDPQSNPVGFVLERDGKITEKLKTIESLLDDDDFRINQYLDFPGMDAVDPKPTSGMTIIHLLILYSSKLDFSEDVKLIIDSIFQKLQDRIEKTDSTSIFNPNYPIMNSLKFVKGQDLHMTSRKKYLELIEFRSKKIKELLDKNFKKLDKYYEQVEFDDESGNSEDEGDLVEDKPAVKYKEHLIEINEFIFEAVKSSGAHNPQSISKRPIEQYSSDYGIPTKSMKAVLGKDGSYTSHIQDIFKRINIKVEEGAKSIISDKLLFS